jgi:hypothetical protein
VMFTLAIDAWFCWTNLVALFSHIAC